MNKFRTYAFWVALSSAIVILVQSIGKLFGFEIDSGIIENLIMSICGVLVVLGIVSKGGSSVSNENYDENASEHATTETPIIDKENNEEVVDVSLPVSSHTAEKTDNSDISIV